MIPNPSQITHQVGEWSGVYTNVIPQAVNPDWTIDALPELGIDMNRLIQDHPTYRKLHLINPVTFCAREKPRFYPKSDSVRKYDNQDKHLELLAKYLDELYKAGVLYKRAGRKCWQLHENVKRLRPGEDETRLVKTKYKISSSAVTGKVFLVDKSHKQRDIARLVVNYSQFSHCNFKWPKFSCPNINNLTRIIPRKNYYMSLDLKSAFFQMYLNIDSSTSLTISDGHTIYGWRTIPMGLGLSPWALTMLTTTLAAIVRDKFKLFCFAYMDDFLLCHNDPSILKTACLSIIDYFQQYGIVINLDRSTPEPVEEITFLGRAISKDVITQTIKQRNRINDLCTGLRTGAQSYVVQNCSSTSGSNRTIKGIWLDYKVRQRIIGFLAYSAPFVTGKFTSLSFAYLSNQSTRTTFWPTQFIDKICSRWSDIKPLQKGSLPKCRYKIFTDASDLGGAVTTVTGKTMLSWNWSWLQHREIYIREAFAAYIGFQLAQHQLNNNGIFAEQRRRRRRRSYPGSQCLNLCDNQTIVRKTFKTLPFDITDKLSPIEFVYVKSADNKADEPSRGYPNTNHSSFRYQVLKTHDQKRQEKLQSHIQQSFSSDDNEFEYERFCPPRCSTPIERLDEEHESESSSSQEPMA